MPSPDPFEPPDPPVAVPPGAAAPADVSAPVSAEVTGALEAEPRSLLVVTHAERSKDKISTQRKANGRRRLQECIVHQQYLGLCAAEHLRRGNLSCPAPSVAGMVAKTELGRASGWASKTDMSFTSQGIVARKATGHEHQIVHLNCYAQGITAARPHQQCPGVPLLQRYSYTMRARPCRGTRPVECSCPLVFVTG